MPDPDPMNRLYPLQPSNICINLDIQVGTYNIQSVCAVGLGAVVRVLVHANVDTVLLLEAEATRDLHLGRQGIPNCGDGENGLSHQGRCSGMSQGSSLKIGEVFHIWGKRDQHAAHIRISSLGHYGITYTTKE